MTPSPYLSDVPCQCAASEAVSGGETEGRVLIEAHWAGIYKCVSMCVFAMDFEFILKVAEKRIKVALGKAEAGKIYFTSATASHSAEAAGFSHGPGLVKKKCLKLPNSVNGQH